MLVGVGLQGLWGFYHIICFDLTEGLDDTREAIIDFEGLRLSNMDLTSSNTLGSHKSFISVSMVSHIGRLVDGLNAKRGS